LSAVAAILTSGRMAVNQRTSSEGVPHAVYSSVSTQWGATPSNKHPHVAEPTKRMCRFNAHEILCCKPNTQRTLLLRLSRCSYDFARLPTSLGGHASAAPTKALPRPLHALIGGAREHLRAPLACLASLAGGIGVVLCRCWCVCWWHRGRGWWGRHERRRCRRWRRWRLWLR
jgi:hypothetical protein